MKSFAIALGLAVLGAGVWYVTRSTETPLTSKGTAGEELPTEGTRKMGERLDKLARAWETTPFEKEQDHWFRANRPTWIPSLRDAVEGSQSLQEVLTLRHKLALELLWAGQTDGAVGELEWLFRAIGNSSTPSNVKRSLIGRIQRDIATAFLRLGEQENCLALHGPDSCLFPIAGGGIHKRPRGSRAALEALNESLASSPNDLGARWLLNVAHMTLGQYPEKVPSQWLIPPDVFASELAIERFPNVAGKLGVDATGLAGGCCVDDFDGDGRLDIVASSWGFRDQLRFFRQKLDGTFEDRTVEAGLVGEIGGLNICHADYDNDGALDVLVLRGGWLGQNGYYPNSLLRNLGDGRFDDVTEEAGLLELRPSQTAAWGDFDNDGHLDLFIGCEQQNGSERQRSQLFHNNGDGTFTDCAELCGLADRGFIKGATWGDYDNDGRIDLYLSRAGEPNVLLHNEGPSESLAPPRSDTTKGSRSLAWSFRDVTASAGVSEPEFSFPTWFFDYDNDGWLDIFVGGFDGSGIDAVAADYLGRPHRRGHPKLYRNRGDGTFDDVTRAAKLDRVLLVMGAGHGDLDGDGFLDIYLGTGAPDFRTLLPNRMFRNANGKVFQDVTTAGGFGHLQKGHGIAFADIDADGDEDIYAVMGGWYTADVARNALFENPGKPGEGHHWITLRLRGRTSNRSAIGTRIRVTVETPTNDREIHRVVDTSSSFGSASLQQEIGLGKCVSIRKIDLRWPSGKTQTIVSPELDRVLEIEEIAQ